MKMNSNRFARPCFGLALIVLSQLVVARAASNPPNVVMIIADDHSYQDFGFLGNKTVYTPNIDRLASQSARYANGYVPMSVCRPSLATLLTGLYPHQHGIHFNHPPPGLRAMRQMTAADYEKTRSTTNYLIQKTATLPRILSEHGYVCLQTGKHWEDDYKAAGFTHGMTLGRPANRLGQVTGTRAQANGEWVAHGNGDAGLVIGRETMQPIDRFLKEHAGKQPFFVWYAPFLPHTPFDAPKRFRELYEGKDVDKHLLPYYAEIARFDETVGYLLSQLEQTGVINNTLIVFVADNGFRPDENQHERQNQRSKLSSFEDGLRTPILISWQGQVRPANHQQIVQTVDLVPTVLSAVGLPKQVTSRMKGLDLMPSARGEAKLPNRPAFGAIYPNDAQALGKPSQHVRAKWVRRGNFKLIIPGPAKPTVPLALFDLQSDPLETKNLASMPEYSNTVADLKALLDEWWPTGDDRAVTK